MSLGFQRFLINCWSWAKWIKTTSRHSSGVVISTKQFQSKKRKKFLKLIYRKHEEQSTLCTSLEHICFILTPFKDTFFIFQSFLDDIFFPYFIDFLEAYFLSIAYNFLSLQTYLKLVETHLSEWNDELPKISSIWQVLKNQQSRGHIVIKHWLLRAKISDVIESPPKKLKSVA
jgi:hypothetical protein